MKLKALNSLRFKKFRVLTENKVSRHISFSALYTAQGIPEGATFFAIPAWLAINGKSALEIASLVSILMIPWSFKLLIAPLMDRYTMLSMGRKRPWVIFGQIGLIISFLCIGFVNDPLNNLSGLMISGFFISLFGAIQDVATDGMAVDVIPEDEQAKVNGIMWGSKTIGISLSMVACTAMINNLGFTKAISLLSVAVAVIISIPILFRERPGEKTMPWTYGKENTSAKKAQVRHWKTMMKDLYKVVKLPSSIIFVVVAFLSGTIAGMVDTALPIFTIQELDWTNTKFSELFSVVNIVTALIGMAIGGYLIDRYGKTRMMMWFMGLQCLTLLAFSLLGQFWSVSWLINGFILTYYLLYILFTIALFAAGMTLSWKVVAATQFTLYMTVSNIGRTWGANFIGILSEYMGWKYIFIVIASLGIAIVIMTRFVNLKSHSSRIKLFKLLKSPFALETG